MSLMKKIIKKIMFKIKYIKFDVKIMKGCNILTSSIFEGKYKIYSYSNIANSIIGFETYIVSRSDIFNTKIGKYCSIGNELKIVIGTHPVNNFASTYPAFFSIHNQAGFTYSMNQKLDDNDIDFLLNFKWWDKDKKWIKNNCKYFENINEFKEKYK